MKAFSLQALRHSLPRQLSQLRQEVVPSIPAPLKTLDQSRNLIIHPAVLCIPRVKGGPDIPFQQFPKAVKRLSPSQRIPRVHALSELHLRVSDIAEKKAPALGRFLPAPRTVCMNSRLGQMQKQNKHSDNSNVIPFHDV